MKIETGNIVVINGQNCIIIENPYIQEELCELDACFAALYADGTVAQFVNNQEQLDTIMQYEILPGVAETLKE